MERVVDRMSVKDRVVFITGAGQGIGRTYAIEFARAGAIPVIAELNADNARKVADEIAAEGGRALAIPTDVGSAASVRAAVREATAAFGRVDVLINNAAVFTPLARRAFEEIPVEEWERVMRVNVTGGWLAASAVVPGMRERGWGRIINVSSSTVPLGLPMFLHYVTSKAAVIGMTRSMARELGPHGITVNCVLPGLTETEVENPGRTDAVRSRVLDLQCIKRLEVPEDLVGAMLFLASPASAFITGQSLVVDGGSAHL